MFRYLQSSTYLALLKGDPTRSSLGYLFRRNKLGRKNPDVEIGLVKVSKKRKRELNKLAATPLDPFVSSISKSRQYLLRIYYITQVLLFEKYSIW